MHNPESHPQLAMQRLHLDDLPENTLPSGYGIRAYRSGDADRCETIIASSFQAPRERFSFDRTMRSDPAFRPERVLFVTHEDTPVGTASAYRFPALDRTGGSLHYVGVLPEYQGKKLGFRVSVAALHQMAREGWSSATLRTDDFRLAAVKTYLALGFKPLIVAGNQRRRWRDVLTAIGREDFCERFADVLAAPVWQPPEHPPDDFDYDALNQPRRRWNGNRPIGRPSRLDVDAFGDESLYRPADLGTAGCSLAEVFAGQEQSFELWFQAGPAGVESATTVSFYTPGQRPLGTAVQDSEAGRPGFIEVVESPSTAVVRPAGTGFQLTAGRLRPGDRVTLRIGAKGGFRWTPLAGRKEFKIILDPGHGEPQMRLPEPVVVRVMPGPAHHADIILPGSAAPADPVRVTVGIRDEYDNRVPVEEVYTVNTPGMATRVPVYEGLGRATLPSMGTAPFWVRGAAGTGELPARSNTCLPADGHNLYFGDLHAHDFTCPAEGYTADVYGWAREDKRLDFVSLAVQSHAYLDNDKWVIHKHMAEAFLDEGRFVTLLACEWQHSHFGDKVIHFLGGDHPYLPVDRRAYDLPCKLYEALRGTDAFIVSHHPGYELDQHVPGTDWQAMETDVDRLVELWSMHGSSEGYAPEDRPLRGARREEGVMAALRQGLRFGLVAGSDTHSGRPGGSVKEPRPYWGGLCGVWAERLTRRALFAAFMARRTYALTGARIALRFTVNGAPMGAESEPADSAAIAIDAWAPGPIVRVELLKNTALLQVFQPDGDECHVRTTDRTQGRAFYHCRVTLADGHLAVCSPVWLG